MKEIAWTAKKLQENHPEQRKLPSVVFGERQTCTSTSATHKADLSEIEQSAAEFFFPFKDGKYGEASAILDLAWLIMHPHTKFQQNPTIRSWAIDDWTIFSAHFLEWGHFYQG